jgi:glycosyltransferase involved in cell wall biosynthesis
VADDVPLVVMMAHLHANKDQPTLLRAWARVAAQRSTPAPVLVLAGRDDGALADLRALGQSLGITTLLRFPGAVADVAGLLDACDLSAFSSRSESCPNGILEAMAAGLAVTASDVPGIRWTLGEDAPLAKPGDDEDLAQHLGRLLDDAALRRALGEKNRTAIATRFAAQPALESYVAALARAYHGGKAMDARKAG